MRTVAVVLAAGTGTRFGPGPAKQLRLLGGHTLLERSVAAFAGAPGIDQVLVVTAAELAAEVRTLLAGTPRLAGVIEGRIVRDARHRARIDRKKSAARVKRAIAQVDAG